MRARFRANTCASQSAWKGGSSASCATGGKPCMPPTSLIRLMRPPAVGHAQPTRRPRDAPARAAMGAPSGGEIYVEYKIVAAAYPETLAGGAGKYGVTQRHAVQDQARRSLRRRDPRDGGRGEELHQPDLPPPQVARGQLPVEPADDEADRPGSRGRAQDGRRRDVDIECGRKARYLVGGFKESRIDTGYPHGSGRAGDTGQADARAEREHDGHGGQQGPPPGGPWRWRAARRAGHDPLPAAVIGGIPAQGELARGPRPELPRARQAAAGQDIQQLAVDGGQREKLGPVRDTVAHEPDERAGEGRVRVIGREKGGRVRRRGDE